MRKLLLVGLIAAAPMLVAPSTASAWGCGYGYGYAPRYYGYSAPRYSTATPRRATTATATPVLAGGSTVREPTAGVPD